MRNQFEMARSSSNGPPSEPRQRTHTHSFFALAGGFVFDTRDLPKEYENILDANNVRKTTVEPLILLAIASYDPDVIPNMSRAEIEDKSKASALAKAIVCFQVLWFLVNTIARLCQSSAISLLELNTFAHALCALLIYFLWWDKALDIEEPVALRSQDTMGLFVRFCLQDLNDGRTKGLIDWTKYSDQVRDPDQFQDSDEARWRYACNALEESLYQTEIPQNCGLLNTVREMLLDHPLKGNPDRLHPFLQEAPSADFAVARVSTWSGVLLTYRIRMTGGMSQSFIDTLFHTLKKSESHGSEGWETLAALCISATIYGGLHLLAWNYPFNSPIHELLWRVSGLTIVASGPAFVVHLAICWLWAGLRINGHYLIYHVYVRNYPRIHWIYGVLALGCVLFYLFARTFLVVECSISFAYLPDAVFEQTRWSYYIPHIS